MQNRRTIFFIGLVIFLMPFLGFPSGFRQFVIGLSGIVLMFLSARKTIEKRINKEKRARTRRREKNPVFVESDPASAAPEVFSSTMNGVSEPRTADDEEE